MNRLFASDGALSTMISYVVSVVELSLLWCLFSLPIITMGVSSTALYYTMNKSVRMKRGYIWSEFWKSWKANFKQATCIWGIFLAIFIVLGADIWVAVFHPDAGIGIGNMYLIFLILCVLNGVWAMYVFPYIARFENRTKIILKNSVFMAIRHLPRTLAMAAILAVGIFLMYIMPFSAIMIPGLVGLGINFFMEGIHRQYMSEEDTEAQL